MASTAAHRSTGWAAGLIAAAVVSRQVVDPYGVWTVITCLAGYLGGTAPDWLENAWWSRGRGPRLWIAHRTWTHWGVAWIVLLGYCYFNLKTFPLAAPAFGFAAGGIMHLLADWPNPLGVPWLFTRRHSLKWWASGNCDYLIILAAWTAALFIADHVWWHDTLWHRTLTLFDAALSKVPYGVRAAASRWLHPFAR